MSAGGRRPSGGPVRDPVLTAAKVSNDAPGCGVGAAEEPCRSVAYGPAMATGDVLIGTCGYRYYDPGQGWQDAYESKLAAYADAFDAVELNRTFYDLPQVSTAERWRREAGPEFVFAMKAWQGLTHGWGSPTWNGHRDAVPDDRTDAVGSLQGTDFVREAWARTRDVAEALEAAVVVVQTPPSFDCTDAHEANLRALFDDVDRGDLAVAWEPRGDWSDHPDRVRDICADLGLLHVVDLMRRDPVLEQSALYTRLHGLNDDRYDYEYDYTDEELDDLAATLEDRAADRDRVYCMFNNYEMYPNARALQRRLDG